MRRPAGNGAAWVVLSNSRGPEKLADLAAGLGPLARAGTVEKAALAGDLVVVTIPLWAYDTVDAGPLAEGWRFQRDPAAYAGLYLGPGGRGGDAGERVDVPTLRSRLAAARRYADTPAS